MTKGKKPDGSSDVLELHYPTLIHWAFFILPLFLITVLVRLNLNYQAVTVGDFCRTLLALNGTLLALVIGFSAFYFAVIDARRIQANQPTQPKWFNEKKQKVAPLLILKNKEKMRAVSILLASIALSYAVILSATYVLYLFSLSLTQTSVIGLPSLWSLLLYFVVLSPIITVADPVIMTWYLTNDVAQTTKYRCPFCKGSFVGMYKYVIHVNECPERLKKTMNPTETNMNPLVGDDFRYRRR